MKAALSIGLVVAIIAAAIIISTRLSDDALALLVGVTCGGGIGIPVSILLVWALVRRTRGQETPQATPQQSYPPVLIIGGNGQPWLPNAHEAPFASLPAARRDFRVIPDDDEDIR